jgi:hypothetical protein
LGSSCRRWLVRLQRLLLLVLATWTCDRLTLYWNEPSNSTSVLAIVHNRLAMYTPPVVMDNALALDARHDTPRVDRLVMVVP